VAPPGLLGAGQAEQDREWEDRQVRREWSGSGEAGRDRADVTGSVRRAALGRALPRALWEHRIRVSSTLLLRSMRTLYTPALDDFVAVFEVVSCLSVTQQLSCLSRHLGRVW
jgi:hypothetical protein